MIEAIDKAWQQKNPGGVPGTALNRVLKNPTGFEWCFSIGGMSQPRKQFFYGDTVNEVCQAAAKHILEKT